MKKNKYAIRTISKYNSLLCSFFYTWSLLGPYAELSHRCDSHGIGFCVPGPIMWEWR